MLAAFSSRFDVGEGALRILLVGQAANVATGSVGFILIMTGFTGLDLLDNALGVALLAGLAVALTAAFGIEGTATAAAVSVAALNLVRLLQVRGRIGIQPYDRSLRRSRSPGDRCGSRSVRRSRGPRRCDVVGVPRCNDRVRARRLCARHPAGAPA